VEDEARERGDSTESEVEGSRPNGRSLLLMEKFLSLLLYKKQTKDIWARGIAP